MDNRKKYYAIEIWVNYDEVDDVNEVYDELEEHLQKNGYDYLMANDPVYEQILYLLVEEELLGWIDTILEDRNIEYRYVTE